MWYRFDHALVRDTLLQSLPAVKRAELHAQVAQHIERVAGDGAVRRAGELYEHFDKAAAILGPERARHYAAVAARSAAERLALAGHDMQHMDRETADLVLDRAMLKLLCGTLKSSNPLG